MKRTITTLALAITILLSSAAFAGGDEKNSTKNLIAGIKSENTGLRKSSIYMAGFYKIEEAATVLSEELTKEKDASTRILIALALYKINDEKGMNTIKNAILTEKDEKAKKMFTAIYNEYILNTSHLTAGNE